MDQAIIFLSQNHLLIDGAIVATGFAVTRWKQFSLLFIAVRIILEVTRYYLRTHPHGKQMARDTNIDERIDGVIPEPLNCLSSGLANHTPRG